MAKEEEKELVQHPTEQAQEPNASTDKVEVEVKANEQENAPKAEPTTQKDVWLANMQKKYPDATEDELYALAMKGYDDDHEFRKNQETSIKNFADLVNKEPEVAQWYKDVANGVDPGVAMLNLGDVYKAYMNGDIDSEGFKEARGKRDQEAKTREENVAKQAKALEDWCEKKGYDPEEWLKQANDKLFTAMSSYGLAEAQFDSLDKMFNYDNDVEAAQTKGRNENIIAQRKAYGEKKGDGITTGSPAGGDNTTRPRSRFEEIAERRKLARDL